jgi:DNA-binding NarL/FixJ family response regulator
VVGRCSEGVSALKVIETDRPDLAVLDLNLPQLHTLELVRRVRDANLPTRIVVLSTKRDRKTAVEALRCGVNAFLLKSAPWNELVEAFDQVLDGGIYISPDVELNKLLTSNGNGGGEDPLECLSTREHQVFSLLIEGLRNKEIASRLELSPKTVDTYRASLMRKLDIHDLAGLVKFAIRWDLTSAGIKTFKTRAASARLGSDGSPYP